MSLNVTYEENAEDAPAIDEPTGERREMIDRLLAQVTELYGNGRCAFADCYGQATIGIDNAVEGEHGRIEERVLICERHFSVLEYILSAATGHGTEVAAFLAYMLDPERSELAREIQVRIEAHLDAEGNDGGE